MRADGATLAVLDAVLVGCAVPFTRPGTFSAIDKRPVEGPVRVGIDGIDGDEQAERSVHGGADKAVMHYAHHHYALWREELGDHPLLRAAGAFGENLSSHGIDERTLCIGDVLRVGTALMQVSQPREPCWKPAERFGIPDLVGRIRATGRSGWYYRVLEPGDVDAGDAIILIERPHPDWPISRMQALRRNSVPEQDVLREALFLPLPQEWLRRFERKLEAIVN